MIKGYYMTVGNKGFFIRTDAEKRTKHIVQCMIQQIAIYRNLCQDWIDRLMQDKQTIDQIRQNMSPAIIKTVTTDNGYKYYSIVGEYFTCNFPEEDFDKDIIVFA